jgi:peptidylprolyl isomerase
VLAPGHAAAPHPKAEDRVKVHYTGWSKGGVMFDSSLVRGLPVIFRVDTKIPAFTEALSLMVAGEKRRIWVPSRLAYGDNPPPGVPRGDLVFDIELLDIDPQPATPLVPEDVKAPPESAVKTGSGLAYRILHKGLGTAHPDAQSRATVNYSVWTPDGRMFDSSIPRGHPESLALSHVMKGLAEGLALMSPGDTFRLWITSDLAYGDHPTRSGVPAGPLVMDVELLRFH